MAVRFCPIASGSSGNSIYIGTDNTHVLVDAGISGKRIEAGLLEIGIQPAKLDALLITHEHKDHIKGAGILSRRFHIPIYATPGTWEAMASELGTVAPKHIKYLYEEEYLKINDLCVEPFSIPHDAAQPVGFSFYSGQQKVTLATDLGHVTKRVEEAVQNTDVLLLEANHDVEMLKSGSYPWYLKQRILGEKGHISNLAAGELLLKTISEKLKYIYLAHLSEENNIPHLAFDTVRDMLEKQNIQVGKQVQLDLATRYCVSKMVEIAE